MAEDVLTIENDVLKKCNYVQKEMVSDTRTIAEKIDVIAWADGKKAESEYNAKFEHIEIPDGVTKIGANAFKNVKVLKSVVIPDSVTEIGENAFMDVKCLKSVVIPDSVTKIWTCAFSGCESLSEVSIGSGVKIIGETAFKDCALTSVSLPEGLERIARWMFYNNEKLREIKIPRSVKTICEKAFANCFLNKVIFSGTVDEWDRIDGREYFWESVVGDEVQCSDGVAHRLTFSIKGNILWKCLDKSAESVEIPDGVEKIWNRAFEDCHLKSVVIPKSVKTIGESAFEDCWALSDISYSGSRAEWAEVDKGFHWKLNAPAKTVKCTEAKPKAKSRYALDLGDWTVEEALSCLSITDSEAEKWELKYEKSLCTEDTDWEEQYDEESVGYFDTKESAVRYFFEQRLFERVREDYVDCLTEESECNDESSLDDLRSELECGERGKPYCGCGYYLSEVDLEPLVKPKKTDEEFLKDNGIDLSVYEDDNEEDDADF